MLSELPAWPPSDGLVVARVPLRPVRGIEGYPTLVGSKTFNFEKKKKKKKKKEQEICKKEEKKKSKGGEKGIGKKGKKKTHPPPQMYVLTSAQVSFPSAWQRHALHLAKSGQTSWPKGEKQKGKPVIKDYNSLVNQVKLKFGVCFYYQMWREFRSQQGGPNAAKVWIILSFFCRVRGNPEAGCATLVHAHILHALPALFRSYDDCSASHIVRHNRLICVPPPFFFFFNFFPASR